jgi:hypothetical protein
MEERHLSGGQVGPTGPTSMPTGHPPQPYTNSHILPSFFTLNSPKTTSSSLYSAILRERKLRKRVEKKSKGSLALNFS